jgi:hypothetical protein
MRMKPGAQSRAQGSQQALSRDAAPPGISGVVLRSGSVADQQ